MIRHLSRPKAFRGVLMSIKGGLNPKTELRKSLNLHPDRHHAKKAGTWITGFRKNLIYIWITPKSCE